MVQRKRSREWSNLENSGRSPQRGSRGSGLPPHLFFVGRQDITGKRAFSVDPRGMLRLTGSLDLAAEATVAAISPELIVPPRLADLMFLIDTGARRTLEIFEALAYGDDREVVRIARRYGAAMMAVEYDSRSILLTGGQRCRARRGISDALRGAGEFKM